MEELSLNGSSNYCSRGLLVVRPFAGNVPVNNASNFDCSLVEDVTDNYSINNCDTTLFNYEIAAAHAMKLENPALNHSN